MENLGSGPAQDNGVYIMEHGAKTSDVKEGAAGQGYFFARVSLKGAKNKQSLLVAIARALKFPSYFGMNWDALLDSLRDMSWRPSPGYVIVLDGFNSLSEKMAEEAEILKKVFEAAAQYWQEKKVPFLVFLS